MKTNFIEVAPGKKLYRGKVESFIFDSKAKQLTLELKSGETIINTTMSCKSVIHLTWSLVSAENDTIMEILSGAEEFYFMVEGASWEEKVIQLFSVYELEDNYWPWKLAFDYLDKEEKEEVA